MEVYDTIMKGLWAEYHTRKEGGSDDFDYSSFEPSTIYSFMELRTEMQGI
jgi:hypothetical protein